MPEFDTFECDQCGDEFAALPSAPAVATGYCSPNCETTDRQV
jgi:hypothetical protein